MGSRPRYYIEANLLIELLENPSTVEPCKTICALIEDAEAGRCELITSVLTISEVLWAKTEADQFAVDPEKQAIIDLLWHPVSSPIQLVPVHELTAREALKLLRDHLGNGWSKTKGNDAIHLITAKRESVDEFLTTEKAMKKWEPLLGFKVCKPHRLVDHDEAPNQLFAGGSQ